MRQPTRPHAPDPDPEPPTQQQPEAPHAPLPPPPPPPQPPLPPPPSEEQAEARQASAQERVLQADDLLDLLLRRLPPEGLLRCAATCRRWRAEATKAVLWLEHRRVQRRRAVPWAPLTTALEARTAAASDFVSWADEYWRSRHGERRGIRGAPAWTAGRDGAPDWPAVVSHREGEEECEYEGEEERVCEVAGAAAAPPRAAAAPPETPPRWWATLVGGAEVSACWVQSPLTWETGIATWQQRQGGPLTQHESAGRVQARNAAVQEVLEALQAGCDLAEKYLAAAQPAATSMAPAPASGMAARQVAVARALAAPPVPSADK